MDMWCPYGIGRDSWDREVLRIVCSPFPPRGGDLPSWCASLRGCRRVGPHRVIVVAVVVVVVVVAVVVVQVNRPPIVFSPAGATCYKTIYYYIGFWVGARTSLCAPPARPARQTLRFPILQRLRFICAYKNQ